MPPEKPSLQMPRPNQNPAAAPATPPTAEFSLELRGGEKDCSNTEYLQVLEDDLSGIDANPMVNNMVGGSATPHLKHSHRDRLPERV